MDDNLNNIKNVDIKKDFLSNERKSSKIEIIKNPILLFIVFLLIFEILFLFNCLPNNIGYKKEIKNRVLTEIINSCNDKNCLECDLKKSECSKCEAGYKLSNGLCSENYSFKAIYSTKSKDENISLFNETYIKDIIEISLDNEKIPISSNYTFPSPGNHTLYFIMNSPSTNSLSYLFKSISRLISITFSSSFNTENVIEMKSMFYGCSSLVSAENL